jgi:hypothetical protein
VESEPVEILGGVQFEMAGQAVAVLQEAGIAVEVRTPMIDPTKVSVSRGIYSLTYLDVAAADAERARALLAERGFPTVPLGGDATSFAEEAAGTPPADDSVRDFLKS